MTTQARSIVREIVTRSYRRYTPTNGRAPEGTEYGVDGWLFDLPGETLNGRRFPQRTYAAYQVTRSAGWVWMVREVGGERRQVGSHSATRKGRSRARGRRGCPRAGEDSRRDGRAGKSRPGHPCTRRRAAYGRRGRRAFPGAGQHG